MAHVMGVRSERTSLFRQGLFSNPLLIVAVFLTFLLQLALLYIPLLQNIFSTIPLTLNELLLCIGLSGIVLLAVEMEKVVRSRMIAKS